MMQEVARSFRAMNTDVLAIVVVETRERAADAEQALADVEQVFTTVEACASRFRPDSELSHLNRSAGRPFAASPLLYDLVDVALQASAATGGAFDPTLLDALERAGYDRSFDELPKVRGVAEAAIASLGAPTTPTMQRPTGAVAQFSVVVNWRDVRLDPAARTITLPIGCRIDLGGIGKGWTVDRACALLRERGYRHFAVDAGGDLYAAGRQGDGAPWSVGVSDPADPTHDLAALTIDGVAVATSTTTRRRWQVGGEARHHLIDPRTRRPAASRVSQATVVAGTVAHAETLAKAALVLGPQDGRALLERHEVAGLLVLPGGGVVCVGRPAFVAAA